MTVSLIAKTTVAKKGSVQQRWLLADASDLVLGRLASDIAVILMGKHKAIYTPHVDTGDFVIVINAAKIRVTGKKLDQEVQDYYTHYPGGRKEVSWRKLHQKHPEKLLHLAVRRMLPKNKLAAKMLKKLKICPGPQHQHQAQLPVVIDLSEGLAAGLQKLASSPG